MAVNGQAGAEIDAGTIGAKFSGLSTLHKLRNQMELTARAGKLSGKVAVATGGSSGLGEAIATRRTDEDPTVADIDKAGAERVACTSKRASFHACDVTNEDEVPRATFDVVAAQHGRVNVLSTTPVSLRAGCRLAGSGHERHDARTGLQADR